MDAVQYADSGLQMEIYMKKYCSVVCLFPHIFNEFLDPETVIKLQKFLDNEQLTTKAVRQEKKGRI